MKYQPHEYQAYTTKFILDHPVAAVLLQMGLGKSVITLTAIQELIYDRFEVRRVLVIAPLRVARDTWPAEIEKWDHLQALTYSIAVGTERERRAALLENTDIHIINRENVQWLVEKSGLPFNYDMIVIDELSSFKSHQAQRFKALMKVRPQVSRIVGLTGTPSSNGLMDLWAQFRVLDMGKRLGRFISRYSKAVQPSAGRFFVAHVRPTLAQRGAAFAGSGKTLDADTKARQAATWAESARRKKPSEGGMFRHLFHRVSAGTSGQICPDVGGKLMFAFRTMTVGTSG